MRVHNCHRKQGVTCTPEFQKKKLASLSVNCGVECAHDCRHAHHRSWTNAFDIRG